MSERLILISKNDGTEEWARSMARIQYAMWVDDGAACSWCQKPYRNVDDFLTRNPKTGRGFAASEDFADWFVDEECWPAYEPVKASP